MPDSLKDSVIEPGDPTYPQVKSTFFRGGAPGIVFQAKNTGQVVEATAFARSHAHVPLGIRSGGHGIRGRSTNDGGIVIDLSRMAKIEVLDRSSRLVRVEPGARWMHVAAALAPLGWAVSSGDSGAVGVGGLATAGGIGLLGRAHGLTIDHLRAVELVLADGAVVRASDRERADLFWAMRGAGSQFGIATSFEFQAAEVRDVGWAQMVFNAEDIAGLLEKFGAIVESSPRDLTSFLILTPPRLGQ
ncbi:MAG TPA: FAD-binding oxidoreductase, partial [Spirochaetia bacterium]|nr:FAD-binding oxidoreductase [Spirochaetia bacterium]